MSDNEAAVAILVSTLAFGAFVFWCALRGKR